MFGHYDSPSRNYSSLYASVLDWCSRSAFTHLNSFPFTPLHRVLHLIAGVETWEGGEGVDPGAARARKRPHEAGDAAQGRDGGWRQRGIHQEVRHQVPGLVDD